MSPHRGHVTCCPIQSKPYVLCEGCTLGMSESLTKEIWAQVPRILNPVVLVLDALPKHCKDPKLAAYVHSMYGSVEGCRKAVLLDFFRHAFDGSGADNFVSSRRLLRICHHQQCKTCHLSWLCGQPAMMTGVHGSGASYQPVDEGRRYL